LTPSNASVVKGEDKEGNYEEYIIRRRLPVTQSILWRLDIMYA